MTSEALHFTGIVRSLPVKSRDGSTKIKWLIFLLPRNRIRFGKSIAKKSFSFCPESNFPWHKFMSPEKKNF